MSGMDRSSLSAEIKACCDANHGMLANRDAEILAERYGVTRRTIRRHAAVVAGRRTAPVRPEDLPFGRLTKEEVVMHYLDLNGNVALLHRRLYAMGAITYSERTLNRRIHEHLTELVRQFVVKGEKAFHDAAVWCRYPPSLRNQLWEVDYLTVKALVVMPRMGTGVQAQVGLVVDRGTGMCLASIVCAHAPTSVEGIGLVAGATVERVITVDGADVVIGGKPDRVLIDNANDLKGGGMREAMRVLGVELVTTNPYAGWEKPNVEALNRLIQDHELNSLPAATRGPRTVRSDSVYDDTPVLSFEALTLIVNAWLEDYNRTTIAQWGESPLQRWTAQAETRPLESIDPDLLRHAAVPAKDKRKISVNGINFKNRLYTSPVVTDPTMRGRYVRVASYPHMHDFIEVFDVDGKKWLGRASLSHTLSPDEREIIQDQRDESRAIMKVRAQRVAELRAAQAVGANAIAADELEPTISALTSIHVPADGPDPSAPSEPSTAADGAGEAADGAATDTSPGEQLVPPSPTAGEPDASADPAASTDEDVLGDFLERLTGRSEKDPVDKPDSDRGAA